MKLSGFLVFALLFCQFANAGKLVYREGAKEEFTKSCLKTEFHPKISSPRGGLIEDSSRTTYQLTCGNEIVSNVTMPSIECSPKGGCLRPPLVTCSRGCISHVTRVEDTQKYDFNLDPHPDGSEVIFGTVSLKSAANVFSSRPLSSNYLAYSEDGVLDRPVIVVEGYDPDNNSFPDLYYYAGFNQLVFNASGYVGRDVFIVNFPKGDDYMDKNASLLQQIIQEINAAKTGNIPTVVIGYSMGGIVARKALHNMEVAGVNHQVSLYVSYDSPHMGANAPMDLQDTVDGLVSKLDDHTLGITSSELKRAQNIYNSPAAREMLIAGPSFHKAVGGDFPQKLVRVAVTAGSLLGVNGMQEASTYEGEAIASFKFYLVDSNIFGELAKSFDWYSEKRGGVYYDNVPGSYDTQFYKAYIQLKKAAVTFKEYLPARVQKITFVPTVSALAMNVSPTSNVKDLFSTKSPFDKFIAADQSGANACTVFNAQTALGQNLTHGIDSEYLNYNELMQLRCALNQYQVPGVAIPSRAGKSL